MRYMHICSGGMKIRRITRVAAGRCGMIRDHQGRAACVPAEGARMSECNGLRLPPCRRMTVVTGSVRN